MIENNIICSTIPDPLLKSKLYTVVINHQIHTCN